jgi:DNA-binding transcriptional regulator YdaS (Cro superfamily)
MDIRSYLQQAERGAGAALARAVGVHPVMVSQWAAGVKAIPVERCTSIEEASGKLVRRWDLRPADWYRIWPELIGTAGAPAIPAPAAEAPPSAFADTMPSEEHAQACDEQRLYVRDGEGLAEDSRHPEHAPERVRETLLREGPSALDPETPVAVPRRRRDECTARPRAD